MNECLAHLGEKKHGLKYKCTEGTLSYLFGGLDALLDVAGHPSEQVIADGGGGLPEVVVGRVEDEAARVAPVRHLDERRGGSLDIRGRDEAERNLVHERVNVALRCVPAKVT